MARRLSFDGYDGGRPVAIPGIPAPVRGGGRAHSLPRVLEMALEQAGLPLGYDAIMGLCGLAFRTPPWPKPPAPSVAEATRAVSALSSALGGCIVILGDAETPGEDAVLDTVAAAVDEGRPCAALGWGSNKDQWSIISGYDRGKGRLIGHCVLDAPRRQYESWPPALRILVALTGRPRPRGRGAVTDALRAGARRITEEGAARCRAWIDEVRLLDGAPGASHEHAVELMADARAAAAGFAEEIATLEREIPAAWLARAAEHWREAVRLLEARGVPGSREALEALATDRGRADWSDLLEAVADLDEDAARAVRLSASADYLPEEARPW